MLDKFYAIGESFEYHGKLITCIKSDREDYSCNGCFFKKKLHCNLKCDSVNRHDHQNVIFIKEKRKKPERDIITTIVNLKKRLKSEASKRMIGEIERYIVSLRKELLTLREK